ncbi:MAG: hypothetical protein NNA30_05920 [Nitrospira sp.]|nr:hypothetical protein [Nitrospira sp.]
MDQAVAERACPFFRAGERRALSIDVRPPLAARLEETSVKGAALLG